MIITSALKVVVSFDIAIDDKIHLALIWLYVQIDLFDCIYITAHVISEICE